MYVLYPHPSLLCRIKRLRLSFFVFIGLLTAFASSFLDCGEKEGEAVAVGLRMCVCACASSFILFPKGRNTLGTGSL